MLIAHRFAFAISLLLALPAVQAASFDCKKASHRVEKWICADAELSALDDQLSRTYREKLAAVVNKPGFQGMQKDWNALLRSQCQDAACVKQQYRAQIDNLKGYDSEEYEANYKSTSVKSLTLSQFTTKGFGFRLVESHVDDATARCHLPADVAAAPLEALYQGPKQQKAVWKQGACTLSFGIDINRKQSVAVRIDSQGCEALCPGGIVFDDQFLTSYEPVADLQ